MVLSQTTGDDINSLYTCVTNTLYHFHSLTPGTRLSLAQSSQLALNLEKPAIERLARVANVGSKRLGNRCHAPVVAGAKLLDLVEEAFDACVVEQHPVAILCTLECGQLVGLLHNGGVRQGARGGGGRRALGNDHAGRGKHSGDVGRLRISGRLCVTLARSPRNTTHRRETVTRSHCVTPLLENRYGFAFDLSAARASERLWTIVHVVGPERVRVDRSNHPLFVNLETGDKVEFDRTHSIRKSHGNRIED